MNTKTTISVTGLACSIVLLAVVSINPGMKRGTQSKNQLLTAYNKLPVTFVENRGQTDERVHYFAQGPHYSFFLTRDEVVLSFVKGSREFEKSRAGPRGIVGPVAFSERPSETPAPEGVVLGLRFVGANPDVQVGGADQAPGKVNYFRGNDPTAWRTGLSSYAQVVYHELWPGVDLAIREKAGSLKYEFRVKPGARIDAIQLAYRGADKLTLDNGGGLLIETALGTLRDAAPVSYQDIGGTRVPVQSHYQLDGNSYGFKVGTGYQADRELIIDPGVDFSTFLGGTSHEIATGIGLDAAGNVYVVGWTMSTNFPTTAGAFDKALQGLTDIFISKLNPTGTALLYSTYLGGIPTPLRSAGADPFEFGRAIAVDSSGNAYITGQTTSSNFPTTKNAYSRLIHASQFDATDVFVTKLSTTGSLVYSTFLGGTDYDDAFAIAVDNTGSAYVTGETLSRDFPVSAGAIQTTSLGGYDGYVTKLNPAGSALVYSTYLGGVDTDMGNAIAVDSSHNAYIAGITRSSDFRTTPGAFDRTFHGLFDGFVTKLNATGTALLYSTFLGGADFDSLDGLAVDLAGNAYVAGGTPSLDFPTTPGAFSKVPGAFVTKLNPTGSALVYSTFVGHGGATAIAVTPAGNVWITGSTVALDFPTTPDAFQHFYHAGGTPPGGADAFVTELNATGSALLYSTYLGGVQVDYGTGIVLDATGNIYVAGETQSADFPVTAHAFSTVFKGDPNLFWGDGFITKFALNGGPPPPPPPPTVASVTPAVVFAVGGIPTTVTVTLSTGAPTGGALVSLSSSNTAVVTVPPTLTIPEGALTGTVAATTWPVSTNTPVTITASFNNTSKSGAFTVTPVPPPAVLAGINLVPDHVTGGDPVLGIVELSDVAPASGFMVSLSSGDTTVAVVPASVTVPAGETSVAFNFSAKAVSTTTTIAIWAMAGSVRTFAPLTVAPPILSSTLTLTVTGRNGQSVTSSPAGLSVPVGSTGQASFGNGTIVLSVSGGRTAIWSGACSSGGKAAKTCFFTLSGNASVTANVQ